MASLNYRILFEVKALHDFYLSQSNGASFFDQPANQQQDVLNRQVAVDSYDVRKDLKFEPTDKTHTLMRNHQMAMIPTQTGFFVGARVEQSFNEADEEVFHLSIPFDNPGNWAFTILPVNTAYRSFTNMNIGVALPSIFFFSNENSDNAKTIPSLAKPVPDFEDGKTYHMGNLTKIAGNLNQAIKRTTSDSDGWMVLPADNHWVNEADRILLPMAFRYQVGTSGVSEINIKLKNVDETLIIEFDTSHEDLKRTFDAQGALRDIDIDFGLFPEISLSDGHYILEISENPGAATDYHVYLSDDLYMTNAIGGIVIQSHDEGIGSSILEDSGELVRIGDSHPVFEIRFKNRNSFWRYRSRQKAGLQAENDAITFLDEIDDDLQTKTPVSLQRMPVQFENGPTKVFLPNPVAPWIKLDDEGRAYTDIFISEVEGLIGTK